MTSDHAVRLRAILDDLEDGKATTWDAAARIRKLSFPQSRRRPVGEHMTASAEGDMPPMPPEGGFHEVEQAYVQGRITIQQYRALAEAAADAMKGE